MAKKLAFVLELEGGQKLVSQLAEVKLEYKDVSKEIKATEKALEIFNKGTDEQKQLLESQGLSVEQLERKYKQLTAESIDLRESQRKLNGDIRDQIKLFNEQGQKVPEDSLLGLRRTYRSLRTEIDQMDGAARRSADGLEKIAKAKEVKDTINEIGKSVGDFREQVGSYEQAVTSVFEKFGIGKGGKGISGIIDPIVGLLGDGGISGFFNDPGILSDEFLSGGPIGELTSALGPGGLLATAGAATLIATADYVSDITLEFEKLFGTVNQVTGVTGRALVESTAQIKALSDTYNIEFDEILRAANATSKAFNSDIRDTLDLIEQGLGSGAEFNNEYLDSLREYPRLVKEAGLSQEEFNEILIRSTQEGIYSDKGIDTIKEGNIRLREQTTATKKALLDTFGQTFTEDLLGRVNDGTTTTFEGMKEISEELSNLQPTAQQTGVILADVFGGPGEDAGIEFIKTLKDIDGNLEDVIDTTNVYYRIQQNQLQANKALAESQANIASQFAGAGTNLRTLGTQAKAFGTDVLDGLLLRVRAVGNEFEKGGFQRGVLQLGATLSGNGLLPTPGELLLRQQDADALAELRKKEAEAEEDRIDANKRGANGIAGLREEQQKLSAAIQDAKAKGEPYKELLIDYEQVTLKLSSATNVLGDSVKKTVDKIKEAGAEGSLGRLKAELSDLTNQQLKASPDAAVELQAKIELKQSEIDDAQNKITEASKKGIADRELAEIKSSANVAELNARLTIDNEKVLQNKLKEIKLETDLEILNNRLSNADKAGIEYIKIQDDIAKKEQQISENALKLSEINQELLISSAVATANTLATSVASSETDLQLRLEEIQLLAANKRIENRLESTTLENTKRLELELEYQNNLDALKKNQSERNLDNADSGTDLRESEALFELSNEVSTLSDFEERKTAIILNAELERLENKKEFAILNGEELLDIEADINLKKLELQENANKKQLDAEKKLADQLKKLDQQRVQVAADTLGAIGESFGALLVQSEEDQKSFGERSLLIILDSVEKIINLYIAQLFAQEIASKSFAGIATAALLTGLVKGALGAAKASISKNEDGNFLGPTDIEDQFMKTFGLNQTPGGATEGKIFRGARHSQNGIPIRRQSGRIDEVEDGEAIINRQSTAIFRPLLSMINSYKGYGKKFVDGAVLGTDVPNLVPVSNNQFNSGFSNEQMLTFATVVANSLNEVFEQGTETIVDKIIEGLDTDQRLKERFSTVQKSA